MKNEQVDITGLMQKPVDGWQVRVEQLAKRENFAVKIKPANSVWEQLSKEEQNRMRWKLRLVAEAAEVMAAGMLKGTLKYDHDNYTVEQWIAHLIGEGTDQMNYQLLLFDAFYRPAT